VGAKKKCKEKSVCVVYLLVLGLLVGVLLEGVEQRVHGAQHRPGGVAADLHHDLVAQQLHVVLIVTERKRRRR
jgi:hypothetical protein